MSRILSVTTRNPSGHSRTAFVPRSECLMFIDDPSPLASRSPLMSAGAAVLNPVKSSVFFFPFLDEMYYGASLYQKFGQYEVPDGGSVTFRGFSWCFKYVTSEDSSTSPTLPASFTYAGDMAAAFDQVARITGLPTFASSVGFARNGESTVPLWLPGPCERFAHPRVTEERQLFFKASRIPSSWSSKVGVTFPYDPPSMLARAAETLPGGIAKIHFFVKTAEHASQLQQCIKDVSKIPAISALAVDYGVTGFAAGRQLNMHGQGGNIRTLVWPYVTDDLSCSIVLDILRQNPMLGHLSIGGPDENVMKIIRAISYRIHLTSLSVDLTMCQNPQQIINLLAYPRDAMVYNLQVISLAFKSKPPNGSLRDLFSQHSHSLTTVRLSEAIPQAHPMCSEDCAAGFFPNEMPHLQKVSFMNLTCSAAAVAQVVALNTPIGIRLQVASEDAFKLNAFLACRTRPPIPSKVTSLQLFDSSSVANLLINPIIWGGLKELHLSKVSLKDISLALMLATSVETLTLEVQFEQNHAIYPGRTEFTLDHTDPSYVFLGNETPWNSLRNCRNLRKLGIFFMERPQQRWTSPTLDARFYFSGLHFLPHLKFFTGNLISAQLMNLLKELAERRQDFSFRASLFGPTN